MKNLLLGIVFVATFLLVTAVFGMCFGILQDEMIERDLDIMSGDNLAAHTHDFSRE